LEDLEGSEVLTPAAVSAKEPLWVDGIGDDTVCIAPPINQGPVSPIKSSDYRGVSHTIFENSRQKGVILYKLNETKKI
jgi:hypothetical protein